MLRISAADYFAKSDANKLAHGATSLPLRCSFSGWVGCPNGARYSNKAKHGGSHGLRFDFQRRGDVDSETEEIRADSVQSKDSVYDKQAADNAVAFIECLSHTKGTRAGQPFLLIDWQERISAMCLNFKTKWIPPVQHSVY
jgi:hypothetical protein